MDNKFKDITVVAIHGMGGIEKEIPALTKTAKGLPGCKTLVITDKLVKTDHPQKLLKQKMDYRGYSEFVIYSLHYYITTPYVLIVQSDGWMLNADNWDDRWFDYDYVGGYTHAAVEGNQLYMWYGWEGNTTNPYVVQNGGFSLRSHKFLEAPSRYGITRRWQENAEFMNEDIQLCCFMRPALDALGLKFAPFEVAKYFSFEHLSPTLHKDLDLMKYFGHHSRFRRLTGDNEMEWRLTDEQMNNIMREGEVLEMFNNYGYQICRT